MFARRGPPSAPLGQRRGFPHSVKLHRRPLVMMRRNALLLPKNLTSARSLGSTCFATLGRCDLFRLPFTHSRRARPSPRRPLQKRRDHRLNGQVGREAEVIGREQNGGFRQWKCPNGHSRLHSVTMVLTPKRALAWLMSGEPSTSKRCRRLAIGRPLRFGFAV